MLRFTVACCLLAFACSVSLAADKVTKYCRFQVNQKTAYGVIEGDSVTELEGDLFEHPKPTTKKHKLSDVKLLIPTTPSKVLALAGNYKSHLPDQKIDPKFEIPQIFYKLPSCLISDGETVVIHPGTNEVHFEAELVLIIGKTAKNVSPEKALDYVFGVTAGNDISARDWQKSDVQWWRAKASDTFGPIYPVIVSGINYDDLRLQMRVNGETLQDQRTKDLIHNCAKQVSYISQHVTLNPGDLIYTGTPGKTAAIKPGDKMEVELEGVGILKNGVAAAK